MNKTGKKYFVKKTKIFDNSINKEVIENYNESYDINNGHFSGTFTIHNYSDLKLNNEYEYCNFSFLGHLDEYQELNKLDYSFDAYGNKIKNLSNIKNVNLLLSRIDIQNNYFLKKYEENIKSQNISSIRIPSYYSVIENATKLQGYSKKDNMAFLEKSDIFLDVVTSNSLKVTKFDSKITFNNEEYTLENFVKSFNFHKDKFPYYSIISYNSEYSRDSQSYSKIFSKYNLFSYIFNTLQNSELQEKLFVNDSSINLKTIILDQVFLSNVINDKPSADFNFLFDLNTFTNEKMLKLSEVLNNDEQYTEIIGYHLRKYEGISKPNGNVKGNPVQEWYIPNCTSDNMSFIDNQVIYNKEYTYTLDPIVLTINNKYTLSLINENNKTYTFGYIRKPVIKIFDTNRLGSIYSSYIKSNPPCEPEIEFIPFISVPNQIKINIKPTINKKMVNSISFSSFEKSNNDKIIVFQNKNVLENMITLESKDNGEFVEIYRTTEKPSSYEAFYDTAITKIPINNMPGLSFTDTLTQNRKYYYTSRIVDFYGNYSNPSEIFEVELTNDGGHVSSMVSPYKIISDNVPSTNVREIKRYLKIRPAIRHRILEEANLNPNTLKLGMDGESVWDKKFKVSVTSKSSGKKMDLYLTFKYKKQDS
jgi:hypothetical protein